MTEMVKYQPLGLTFERPLTWEEGEININTLTVLKKYLPYYWGDMLNHLEKVYPEKWTQLVPDDIGTIKTLGNWKWVCDRIPIADRRKELSFSHHAEVARCEHRIRDEYLDMAIQENWTISQMRVAVRGPREKKVKEIVCPKCGERWEE